MYNKQFTAKSLILGCNRLECIKCVYLCLCPDSAIFHTLIGKQHGLCIDGLQFLHLHYSTCCFFGLNKQCKHGPSRFGASSPGCFKKLKPLPEFVVKEHYFKIRQSTGRRSNFVARPQDL